MRSTGKGILVAAVVLFLVYHYGVWLPERWSGLTASDRFFYLRHTPRLVVTIALAVMILGIKAWLKRRQN
jgi:hypothetical protein